MKLFVELAEAGVLIAPGAMFGADQVHPPEEGRGHFRIAFSNASVSRIFCYCLRKIIDVVKSNPGRRLEESCPNLQQGRSQVLPAVGGFGIKKRCRKYAQWC